MDSRISNLMAFLDSAHSVYHAVSHLVSLLEKQGYTPLREAAPWEIAPGGKYYVTRGGSALIAFRVPKTRPTGFLMSASHADRPTFQVKENGVLTGAYTRLAVERYGGMLIAPWLDRPLSVAGRVMVQTETGLESRLVDIDRDLLLIPNVAVHMNRKANEGCAWNPAVDTLPLLGGSDSQFWEMIEAAAGGKVLGHDLYLYIRQKSTCWGMNEEYLSSAALDDLECVWGCTQGFLGAERQETESIPLLCVFDSEEVGSGSLQGAAADFLQSATTRICRGLGLDEKQALAQSFLVSADNAHALHPNHPEYADSANAPVMNGGVVLKFNANQRYTTSGVSAGVFRKICQKANVPVQTYCNRADIAGGSTLGHISLSQVSVPSVDIGLAQLAMHSCYETAGVQDAIYLEQAMTAYYGSRYAHPADGQYIVE